MNETKIKTYTTFGTSFTDTHTKTAAPTPIMPPSLNFVTGNANKLAEVEAILHDVVPLTSRSVDLVEIQGSMEEVSRDKCRRAADIVGN